MNIRGIYYLVITLMILGWSSNLSFGQGDSLQSETSVVVSKKTSKPAFRDTLVARSPAKAALYSAIVPGLGQAYNGKFWKIPIVYAGIGTSLFFVFDNRANYRLYRDSYIAEIDCDTTTKRSPKINAALETASLREQADLSRQQMELSYIIAGAFYVLNIVDASVDAHLSTFDVSDDLSLRVRPNVFSTRGSGQMFMGLNLQLKFKR